MDLGGRQRGILKLARRAVIVPLERVFGMEIMDYQAEEQENEQEGDVELFFIRLCHRIPCGFNIRETGGKCQTIMLIPFKGPQFLVCDRDGSLKAEF